jgi:hypothetical protein
MMAIEMRTYSPTGQYVTLDDMIEIVSRLTADGFDGRTYIKVDTSLDGVFDFSDPGVYVVRVIARMDAGPHSTTSKEQGH